MLWESTEDKDKECVLGGSGCPKAEWVEGGRKMGRKEEKGFLFRSKWADVHLAVPGLQV